MNGLLRFILAILVSPLRSKARLQAENAALRHQVIVLHRKSRGKVRLTNSDRWFFVQLYRLFPSIARALHLIRPETLIRWHRAGFRGIGAGSLAIAAGAPQTTRGLRRQTPGGGPATPPWGGPPLPAE